MNLQSTKTQAPDGSVRPIAGSVVRIGVLFATAFTPTFAAAYIGPGAGITMVGALWAVVVAVVFAVGGLLIWPLRAFLRRRKVAAGTAPDADPTAQPAATLEKQATEQPVLPAVSDKEAG